jgi:hypothetical protein
MFLPMQFQWWEEHDTGFIAVGLLIGGLYGRFFVEELSTRLLSLLGGLLLGLILAHFSKTNG